MAKQNTQPTEEKQGDQPKQVSNIQTFLLPISIMFAGLLLGGGILGAAWINSNSTDDGNTSGQVDATEELTRFAVEQGVNEGEFSTCLEQEEFASRIEQDVSEVPETGTPHSILFAGDTRVAFSGALTVNMVSSLIDPLTTGDTATLQSAVSTINEEAGRELVTINDSDSVRPVDSNDHIRGPRDADIFMLEYSDLQCPFCERFHGTAQTLLQQYNSGDTSFAWIYRHHPLPQLHPHATEMAIATECVADQLGEEGFWKYTDTLFQNQALFSEAR